MGTGAMRCPYCDHGIQNCTCMPMGKYFKKSKDDTEIVHEVECKLDKKSGMYYRPGTSDKKMIKESRDDYPKVECKDKVVLDLGANVGGFTKIALDQGVKKIVAYEPDDFNFEMLEINIRDDRATLVKAAVIATDDDHIEFYLNGSGNSACSGSVLKKRNAVDVKRVNAVNFKKIVEEHKPDLIKMDVEGAEFELLEDYDIPEYVKEIAIELHGFRKANFVKMQPCFDKFLNEGWELLYKDTQLVFNSPCILIGHFRRN